MSILNTFADLRTSDLSVPSHLSAKTIRGLELLAAIAATATMAEEATRTFNVIRSVAVTDAAEGKPQAAWSWGWKGCSIVTSDGTVVKRFEKGRDEAYCRSSDILEAMEANGEDLILQLDPRS